MKTVLGFLFFITWPFLLLMAIPLIFLAIELAPILIVVALIGAGGAALKRSF